MNACTTIPKNILITGANRGLGLGFVKEMLTQCNTSKIFATVRDLNKCQELKKIAETNKNLFILKCDVTVQTDIDSLYKQVEANIKEDGLQYLINNAGILHRCDPNADVKNGIPPNIEGETIATWMNTYQTNVVAPFFIVKKFIPLLTKGGLKHPRKHSYVINLTSFLGSIAANDSSGFLSYRSSKAALNILGKSLAIELKEHNIIVVSLSPGWVKTDMGGPTAPLEVTESVMGMLNVLRNLETKDNGLHFDYTGKQLPW